MATTVVVGVSTGAMKPVLEKLATLMGSEFSKMKNVRKDVKFLSDELTSMKDLLERLALVDDELDPQTKRWRDKVRDMSYDIENIIDDFGRKIVEKNEKGGLVKKAVRFLKTFNARYQIDGIKKLVHETSDRRNRYQIVTPPPNDATIDPRVAILQQDAASLVGLKVPIDELVGWLNDEEMHLKVVSIVGFGGLGKTTLANDIYRQPDGGFECRAFVPVTQKHNIPKLIRSLLSELGSDACSYDCEVNVLVNKLKEYLEKKRYLIVIDDLWEKLPWDIIKGAFPDNGVGSRVITTTRIHDVAKACCSHPRDYILEMKPLSDEDSRRLFFNRIYNNEQACPRQFRDISTEILKKCDEDFEIPRHHLELQWIAEGFISKENGQDVEKNARSYFNELVNRSLIQPIRFDNCGLVTHCKVHDMMRDLILHKCAEENFLTIVDDPQSITKLDNKVRRLSVHLDDDEIDGIKLWGNISLSHVRTFMIFGAYKGMPPLRLFRFLRVLHIEIYAYDTVDLTGLSNMYQLRYLGAGGGCSGVELPTQITGLGHLETLDVLPFYLLHPFDIFHLPSLLFLNVDWRLARTPYGIGNMKSLRYVKEFDLMKNSLDNIESLGELHSLRVLSVYGYPPDATSIKSRMDALCSSLGKNCISLEYLGLYIKGCMDALMDLSPPPRRLERLWMGDRVEYYFSEGCDSIDQPAELGECSSVFRLPGWISKADECCFFSRVPNWMGELSNLKELEINVRKPDVGILAGLPALTFLRIYIIEFLRDWFFIHAREFPVLKHLELRLSSPSYLAFQAGAMPKLQWLGLQFRVRGWNQNVPGPAGLHHLSALEDFFAIILTEGATEYEKTCAESALKTSIKLRPNHPRLHIQSSCDDDFRLVSFPSDESGGVAAPRNRGA
ncbi:hypothetical protein CFC21_090366 [Triticum aestivum]|uniref:Uncharacterized protein n=2 Tax=Triticum aestivum TaxID=4565 RepID=A0A9R1LE40_WHEAT|nr:disease resistance protein RGA5-like isoform X2 [Triticum aestivum]KAF7087153.1 hypothetical protein CFC21_090366 [Triticum aestivum]